MRACANILAGITSLCISLMALFLVIWVSIKLTDISFNGLDYEFQCLLGTNENRYTFTSNNCLMLQILSGLTIGVGFVIGIIQCFTCNLCGLGGVLDGLFALLGAGAWGYAAGVLQTAVDSNGNLAGELAANQNPDIVNTALNAAMSAAGVGASELGSDYDTVLSQRTTTGILTWVEFGLFCFLLLLTLLKCCPGRHK